MTKGYYLLGFVILLTIILAKAGNEKKYIVQYIDAAQLETEIVNSTQLDSLINILESSKTKYWIEDYQNVC